MQEVWEKTVGSRMCLHPDVLSINEQLVSQRLSVFQSGFNPGAHRPQQPRRQRSDSSFSPCQSCRDSVDLTNHPPSKVTSSSSVSVSRLGAFPLTQRATQLVAGVCE